MKIDIRDIQFQRRIPLKHMSPNGHLPMTDEASALWNFLACAHAALSRVEQQVTLEGAEDQTADLMQLAHSVRKIYNVELERMFQGRLVAAAQREAIRCGMPWDSRLDAFFRSGGKSFRILDRNPDKVGEFG